MMVAPTPSFSFGYCCRTRSATSVSSVRCLREGDARLQPADARKIIVIALFITVFRKLISLELRLARGKLKIRRHDPNDRVGFIVENHRLSYNTCIAPEIRLPQRVAQHDRARSARLVIMLIQVAAKQRRPSQRAGEKVPGHPGSLQPLWLAFANQVHGEIGRRCQRFERCTPPP